MAEDKTNMAKGGKAEAAKQAAKLQTSAVKKVPVTVRKPAATKTTAAAVNKPVATKSAAATKKPAPAKKTEAKSTVVAKPSKQVEKLLDNKDIHYGVGEKLPDYLI